MSRREEIARAVFDPGSTAGLKGDRSFQEWVADAILALPPVETSELVKRLGHIASWLDLSCSPTHPEEAIREAATALDLKDAEIARLKEWKGAIIGLCAAIGSDSMEWGGDKTGWGFIHFFVKHLHTRAEKAEQERDEIDAESKRFAGQALEYCEQRDEALKALEPFLSVLRRSSPVLLHGFELQVERPALEAASEVYNRLVKKGS